MDWANGEFEKGFQVWRSADGVTWTQVNESGFGDPYNFISHQSVAVAEYKGSLYYGLKNNNGGQVWKMSLGKD